MQNPPWDPRPSGMRRLQISVQSSGGPRWQSPFPLLSLVQAGDEPMGITTDRE